MPSFWVPSDWLRRAMADIPKLMASVEVLCRLLGDVTQEERRRVIRAVCILLDGQAPNWPLEEANP